MSKSEHSEKWLAAIKQAKETLFKAGVTRFTGDTVVSLAMEIVKEQDRGAEKVSARCSIR